MISPSAAVLAALVGGLPLVGVAADGAFLGLDTRAAGAVARESAFVTGAAAESTAAPGGLPPRADGTRTADSDPEPAALAAALTGVALFVDAALLAGAAFAAAALLSGAAFVDAALPAGAAFAVAALLAGAAFAAALAAAVFAGVVFAGVVFAGVVFAAVVAGGVLLGAVLLGAVLLVAVLLGAVLLGVLVVAGLVVTALSAVVLLGAVLPAAVPVDLLGEALLAVVAFVGFGAAFAVLCVDLPVRPPVGPEFAAFVAFAALDAVPVRLFGPSDRATPADVTLDRPVVFVAGTARPVVVSAGVRVPSARSGEAFAGRALAGAGRPTPALSAMTFPQMKATGAARAAHW